MPTAELVNPFAFDLFRPRGENVIAFTATVAAVLAQQSAVWLLPGPGTFLVPLWFQATFAAGSLFVGWASKSASPVAITNITIATDSRAFGATVDLGVNLDNTQIRGGAVWGSTTLAPLGASQTFMVLPAGLAQLLNIGLVLTRPNTALVFTSGAVNQSLTLTFVGYERSFEPQENV